MSALAARSEQADVLTAAADELGQVCLVRAGVDGVEDGLFEAFVGPSGSGKSLLDASDLGEFGHVDQVATDVGTESRPDLFLYGLTHARVTANMVGSSKPRELAATSTLTSANRPNPAGHRVIPSCPKEVAMPTAICPECRQPMDVEYVDNGVYMMWHGVHCGWGREFSSEDVRMPDGSTGTPEMASPPMAGDSW